MMNPSKFLQFQNDLRAAIIARVPVEISDTPLNSRKRQLAELDELQSRLQPQLESESSLGSLLDSEPDLPGRYRAALIAFDRLDSMVPVLETLSVRCQAVAKVTSVIRRTVFYLMLVMLIAFLGLWFFDYKIVPVILDMRADLSLMAAIRPADRVDTMPWIPAIVGLLGVGIGLGLIGLLIGGANRLAWWMGGRKFVRCEVASTVVRLVHSLLSAGMNVDQAVTTSCNLAGADSSTRHEVRTATQGAIPGVANHFDALADYFDMMAWRRLANVKVVSPIVLISVVGGTVAGVYGILVFWPIISMLKDLTTAGV